MCESCQEEAKKQTCRAMKRNGVCGKPLTPMDVSYGGFCSSCWYPGIGADHVRYRELRDEGHSPYQAGVQAGLFDPDEAAA